MIFKSIIVSIRMEKRECIVTHFLLKFEPVQAT